MSPSEICAIGQETKPQGGCSPPLLFPSVLAGHAICRYKGVGAPRCPSVRFGPKPMRIRHGWLLVPLLYEKLSATELKSTLSPAILPPPMFSAYDCGYIPVSKLKCNIFYMHGHLL